MDPFYDLIRLLRPQATLWTRVDANGRWGLSFRALNDVLFCWIERGSCQLTRPGLAPMTLSVNDFVLVRASTPFNLVSDTEVEPIASEAVLPRAGAVATLGDGSRPDTVLRGGKFIFNTANERLLTGLIPQVMHLAAKATASDRVRALLRVNEDEARTPGPGSAFVVARLMELTLIELLRTGTQGPDPARAGLLTGLADPLAAKALVAMHSDVAHPWTTAKLARLCGLSRSALSARFSRLVGLGPIEYLQQWRFALAKEELRQGSHSIGEIALRVGFQSGSAFSTAFTKAEGCSPRNYKLQQVHVSAPPG